MFTPAKQPNKVWTASSDIFSEFIYTMHSIRETRVCVCARVAAETNIKLSNLIKNWIKCNFVLDDVSVSSV